MVIAVLVVPLLSFSFVKVTSPRPTQALTQVLGEADTSTSDTYQFFLSSQTYTGNLGGISGANSQCNALATRAGLSGQWNAWLSTQTNPILTRIDPSLPAELINGTQIADSIQAMVDCPNNSCLKSPIQIDENGTLVSASFVLPNTWTGTPHAGSDIPSGDACSDWSLGTKNGTALGGNFVTVTTHWTQNATATCDQPKRLYCYSKVLGAQATPTPVFSPTAGPLPSNTPTPTPKVSVIPSITVSPPPTCPRKPEGDANCDDLVDLVDYDIWKNDFLNSSTILVRADFNGDQKADEYDFEIFRNTYANASVQPTKAVQQLPYYTLEQCPQSGYVNCQPSAGVVNPLCNPEFEQWAELNCIHFEGLTY